MCIHHVVMRRLHRDKKKSETELETHLQTFARNNMWLQNLESTHRIVESVVCLAPAHKFCLI